MWAIPLIALVMLNQCVFTRSLPHGAIGTFVMGGSDSSPGAWPWQLTMERYSGGAWVHSCGAILLATNLALTAAQCVDGMNVINLRIRAGVYGRSSSSQAQTVNLTRYRMHENYGVGTASIANDIALLYFASDVSLNENVTGATLPQDSSNDYSGSTCVITGWGRTGSSPGYAENLQEAEVQVLTTSDCQSKLQSGLYVWSGQICAFDPTMTSGACSGDSGGPLNCPVADGYEIAGIASWVVAGPSGSCQAAYPSVYTRTSSYLDWIQNNLPLTTR